MENKRFYYVFKLKKNIYTIFQIPILYFSNTKISTKIYFVRGSNEIDRIYPAHLFYIIHVSTLVFVAAET